MQSLTTILFDLDGTIVDTEQSAAQAVQECFQGWGLSIHPEDARYLTGRTWESAFDFLFSRYTLPLSREAASRKMIETYRHHLETHLPVVPGAPQAIRALAEKFELGLVSGSNRTEILWALNKLGLTDQFTVILGAEDYARSKPAPDGYIRALETLQASPQCTLVFEDSFPGITAARAAGAWVIAVTSTNHFQQDNTAAHYHIPDFTGVNPDWVHEISSRLS